MYRKQFIDLYLKKHFDYEEAKSEVDFALDVLFNYKYKDFILGKSIEDWQKEKLLKIIEERVSTHRPIQQIIGLAPFYKRIFFVDNSTLIPRPETELLIDEVLNLSKLFENPKILDIGTGSGCIPITLILENKNIYAEGIDISDSTVEMAKKNTLFHNIFQKIKIFQSNLFENVKDKYNIIVSNPPYIPLREKDNLEIEVKNFDPPLALFTNDDDGIEFYEKICKKAKDYLYENGYIVFEIGINQQDKVTKILEKNNFKEIKFIKDLNNIDRVIIAKN